MGAMTIWISLCAVWILEWRTMLTIQLVLGIITFSAGLETRDGGNEGGKLRFEWLPKTDSTKVKPRKVHSSLDFLLRMVTFNGSQLAKNKSRFSGKLNVTTTLQEELAYLFKKCLRVFMSMSNWSNFITNVYFCQ